MTNLRVLSYNIHKGFTASNRRYVLSEIRDEIRMVNADLVFLQEVSGAHGRHPGNQLEFLADQVWPHMSYGKNAVYTNGHHGNAILSRYPIIRWENINISAHAYENRGMLHAVVKPEPTGLPLHLICIHLGLTAFGREKQVQQLARRIENEVEADEPLIVAGDFNDWNQRVSRVLADSLGIREAFREVQGKHARTFPSFFPWLHLDRIYFRGLHASQAQCFTHHPWRGLSDHLALFTEFKTREEKQNGDSQASG
ncbi:MAG: endonuclease/exonuclease/phosphatase family protein [Bacteriovoracia bacterium]